jgi:hypothetical protein
MPRRNLREEREVVFMERIVGAKEEEETVEEGRPDSDCEGAEEEEGE